MHRLSITAATVLGCASPSPTEVSNVGRVSEQVTVRFAARGEFPVKQTVSDMEILEMLSRDCDRSGPPTPAYYRPIVAFAREHMVDHNEKRVHESLIGPNTPLPKLHDGTNVIVDPRGATPRAMNAIRAGHRSLHGRSQDADRASFEQHADALLPPQIASSLSW